MQTITGFQPYEVSALNEKTVRWGILKEMDDLQKYVPRQANQDSNEYGVEKRVEDSEIPLPPLTDEQRHEILQNLSLRKILIESFFLILIGVHLESDNTLPSVCFYTFLNSQKR
jgi:hypothetical protein